MDEATMQETAIPRTITSRLEAAGMTPQTDAASGLETLAAETEPIQSKRSEVISTLIHNIRNQWVSVIGWLELYKDYTIKTTPTTIGESKPYEPLHEASRGVYKEMQTMLDRYVRGSYIAGIDGNRFNGEIQDFIERIEHMKRNLLCADIEYQRYKTPNPNIKIEWEPLYERLNNQLNNIQQQLRDILKLSADDNSEMEKAEFDLNEPIEMARDNVEELASNKNIVINVENNYSGKIYSNQLVVACIIENYLSNAIKYSKPNTQVTVRAYEKSADGEESKIVIEVEDKGIGMAPKEVAEAFNQRYMVPKTLAELAEIELMPKDRSGLGLWLNKELAQRLGGRVSVASQKGKGSTFYLEMPIGIENEGIDRHTTLETATTGKVHLDYAA